MIDLDQQFNNLTKQLEDLFMCKLPLVKNREIILSHQDYDEEEVKKKDVALDSLRKLYSEIVKELIKLDRNRANLEVNRIIKMRRQLDNNHVEDMKALGGWIGHEKEIFETYLRNLQ